jgi:hypothetical protein
LFITFPVVEAQQSNGTIAQGFQTEGNSDDIVAGALVIIKDGKARLVDLATLDSAGRLIGVIDKNPLVAISNDSQEVQVVLSGTTNVLVSDINGPIKASDKITASPIAGVGMLATGNSQVVGTAQTDFETDSSQTRTITDRDGKSHNVHIGYVPLQVGVSYYQAPGSNFLPPFVQNIANSVAGRPVSLVRVLISSILLLLGFVYGGILTFTAVRSSMNSIGRNPMAAGAIRKGLYQAGLVSVVVVGVALLGSYLVLSF